MTSSKAVFNPIISSFSSTLKSLIEASRKFKFYGSISINFLKCSLIKINTLFPAANNTNNA